MQIYWNKRKRLHKKRVQLPQDCLGTPIWPPWRHVKTLYSYYTKLGRTKRLNKGDIKLHKLNGSEKKYNNMQEETSYM